MGRDWQFEVTGANGGSVLASDLPWRTARASWVLDSPGAIEIDLREEDMSDDYAPGTHRVRLVESPGGDANMWGAWYITHIGQAGPPDDVQFRVAGLGLEYIFDWRIIHHEWADRATVATHLETMLDDLQVQQSPGGDMGFSNDVTVAFGGGGPARLRSFCLGVVAGDLIRELAALGNGFDWEIDVYQTPPVLTIYRPKRGGDLTGLFTLTPGDCQMLTVELDTSDLLTTVTAMGEKSDPFGPRHNLARTALGDVYGRHEVVIDTDVGGDDADEIRDNLYDAAYEELQQRAGGRLQVRAMFIDNENAPWSFGDVWIGDEVTLDLPSWYGGSQPGRITEMAINLEPGQNEYLEYTFDTLVEDITEGAESS